MPDTYPQSLIAWLPSYRAGSPNVLLEGASCTRLFNGFDLPGCRKVAEAEFSQNIIAAETFVVWDEVL